MKIWSSLAIAFLLLGMGSLEANAWFNLTGVWEGIWTCRVQIDGSPTIIKNKFSVMKITHTDSEVNVDLDNDEWHYHGWAAANNQNADKGATTFVECRTSPASRAYNEVVSAVVKAPSGAATGEFKGTSAYNSTDATETDLGGICIYTFKRVSSHDPEIGPCLSTVPPVGAR